MALKGNGQLLVRVQQAAFSSIFAEDANANIALRDDAPFRLPGYSLEPLSPAPQLRATFTAQAIGNHWLLAKPVASGGEENPWDAAHAAAAANGYKHFVEPDVEHRRAPPPTGVLDGGLNKDWPPGPNDHVSPVWHLKSGFTRFESAWARTKGAGVKIAHLDTGYTPGHASRPRHLREHLAYDFWTNKPGAVDPGDAGLGLMPGHGTATLALLAGAAMDLTFGTQNYKGDIGGAPDADVIPVRISPSVIHLYTSTMARGLYYALAPGGDPANKCDVVSISHGGLPSASWADAVNMLYDDGVTIVAASGDSIYLVLLDLATRFTVYPAAFNRVLTALGATYAKKPYITKKFGVMQGCWGPKDVMEKAIAAYTPNVAWMQFKDLPGGFSMDGGGTSSSTPQIAAACALWLQLYRAHLPADWRRVEACRLALFDSADHDHPDKDHLGWGLLNAANMLDDKRSKEIVAKANGGALGKSGVDVVSFPFWRLLLGAAPPNSEQERMYEAEVAQVVMQSDNHELLHAAARAFEGETFSDDERAKYRALLTAEGVSAALRNRVEKL